jgi:Rrf2 family transcriptional regulator, iron-sulfur cluster assembly transcription factor
MSGFGYSKMSRNAIAAMSYLAGQYADKTALASSAQIANARRLPQTLVAKILTILSQAGYVTGSPGPKGGYRLARSPETICFYDVVSHFDPISDSFPCPYGVDYCPNENPCPVHDNMAIMRESVERFMKDTNFGLFV